MMSEQGQNLAKWKRTRRNVLAIGGVLTGALFSRLSNKPAQAIALACFVKGTRLLTPDGERPIEELKIGDLITTAGGAKRIEWIGRRTYKRTGSAHWVEDVRPVRITRGALSNNTPHTDLWVSQLHGMLIDGIRVRAVDLVNGSSIVLDQGEFWSEIEYLHVKLEAHDIVFAEGAASETVHVSFAGSLELFDNFAEYERLYGAGKGSVVEEPCAPMVVPGGARERIASRVRSLLSPWVDRRNDFDRIRDRLEERAGLVNAR